MDALNVPKTYHKVSVTQDLRFSDEEIIDIVIGIFEGGVSYWAGVGEVLSCGTPRYEGKPPHKSRSEWLAKHILDGRGVIFFDREDREEVGVLTLTKLLKGIQMNHSYNQDPDNYDADDYDRIAQYAVMGSLVYG